MIDDDIRKYTRAIVDDSDQIEVSITSLSNYKGEAVLRPILVEPIDIGAYGMKFRCKYLLTKGVKIGLTIILNDKKIDAFANIVRLERVGGKYDVAVNFVSLTEYQVLILSSYIKRKTVDSIRRLREH